MLFNFLRPRTWIRKALLVFLIFDFAILLFFLGIPTIQFNNSYWKLKSLPATKGWNLFLEDSTTTLTTTLFKTTPKTKTNTRIVKKNNSKTIKTARYIIGTEHTDEHFDKYNASWFSSHSGHPKDSIRIHYYNKQFWLVPTVFDKCKYRCHLTWGRKRYKEVDYVIFFGPRLHKDKAPRKPLGQTWIYHAKESMANYGPIDKSWRNKFNWTMAMRRDSDSCAYNGFVKSINGKFDMEKLKENWKKKDKGAAWFVTNCSDACKRRKFVKALNKHMNIDIYGGCGKYKCPRSNESKCFDILDKRYKIYLAFENSLCRDYITEKGFNMFDKDMDVVPVVRGIPRSHYDIYFPPNSYIATEDFSSVKELGKYLNKVVEQFDVFSQYFRYRQFYKGFFSFPLEFCNICERAHKADKYKRLYSDMNIFERGGTHMNICRKAIDVD